MKALAHIIPPSPTSPIILVCPWEKECAQVSHCLPPPKSLTTFPQGLALIYHPLSHPQQNCCPCSFPPSSQASSSQLLSALIPTAYQNLKMMPVATRTMMMEMVIVT